MKVTATTVIYGKDINAPEDIHPLPTTPDHYTFLWIRSNELHPERCTLVFPASKGREIGIDISINEVRRMLNAVGV